MTYNELLNKLDTHGKQLADRILASNLEHYNNTLKHPRKNPTWSQRKGHICVRLIQAGLSKQEIEDIFTSFPVGTNMMCQADPKRYFEALYQKSQNLVQLEKVKIVIGSSLRNR
ncbi:hypothetical protein [Paenibacillus amylolyticus]|uniref:hypothetical protein n=1 Tax=Paenibacillus amylolyticus TaxID=1451 RepID=UPI000FD7B12F|nr:hypothetical protein [Paenibacillus amylolyticus]